MSSSVDENPVRDPMPCEDDQHRGQRVFGHHSSEIAGRGADIPDVSRRHPNWESSTWLVGEFVRILARGGGETLAGSVELVQCLEGLIRLRQARWKEVGSLPGNATKTSGTPCIHNKQLVRSVRFQGEKISQGHLLVAELGHLGVDGWREVTLPKPPPGHSWSKRVYAFSLGNLLYVIVTVWEKEMRDIPPAVLFCTNLSQTEGTWHRVKEFSCSRLHFGAELFGNKLVIIGGCDYVSNGPDGRRYLRTAECITLDGLTANDWVPLPDLPRDAKKIRMVVFCRLLCMVGTFSKEYDECRKVLTLPMSALETTSGQQQQVTENGDPVQAPVDQVSWSEGKVPDVPYKNSSLAVVEHNLIVAGGENTEGQPMPDVYVLNMFSEGDGCSWERLESLEHAREHARLVTAGAGGGIVYSVGGRSRDHICERAISRLEFLPRPPRSSSALAHYLRPASNA